MAKIKKVENPNGRYPIYGSGGVMGYADNYICEANTVIMGRKGNINNPIFVDEPFWNVDTAFGLVARQGVLLPKYLYFFCKNFNFEKLNTTVTIPSLTKSNLLKIEMSLPSIDEQESIVTKLESIDKLVNLQKAQLKTYDNLIKSRFVEMFGEPVGNSKKWATMTLRQAGMRLSDGPFGSNLKSEHYTEAGIRVIRLGNIGVGKFIDKDQAYVSNEHYEKIKNILVEQVKL